MQPFFSPIFKAVEQSVFVTSQSTLYVTVLAAQFESMILVKVCKFKYYAYQHNAVLIKNESWSIYIIEISPFLWLRDYIIHNYSSTANTYWQNILELTQLRNSWTWLSCKIVSSKFKSLCQLYKQMLNDAVTAVISELHKICNVLHFIKIRKMSGIFPNLANLYRIYNDLPISSASAEWSFSRLRANKKLHMLNYRWDPIVGHVIVEYWEGIFGKFRC